MEDATVGGGLEGEAEMDGANVDGILVGKNEGDALGDVGACDSDGEIDGCTVIVGLRVGNSLGLKLSIFVAVGQAVGFAVGVPVGCKDG